MLVNDKQKPCVNKRLLLYLCMTTREAFEQLINKRAWYTDLEITEVTASALKSNFKKDKVTLDKMEEILTKAGFTVKQEKLWQK